MDSELEMQHPMPIQFSTITSSKNITLGTLVRAPLLQVVKTRDYDATDILLSVDEDLVLGYNPASNYLEYFVLIVDKCFDIKTIETFDTREQKRIKNVTINGSKQILSTLIPRSTSWLYHMTDGDRLKYLNFHNMESLIPTAIYFDKKGHIFVGYTDTDSFQVSWVSKRGFMVYNDAYLKLADIYYTQFNNNQLQ